MDTIGKVLRKTNSDGPSQSVHKTTNYEKLAQEPSDEEIDDDVVFLQEGAVLHRNGFSGGNHTEIIASAIQNTDDAALVGLLQKGKVGSKRPPGSDFVEVKTARMRCCRRLLGRHRVAVCLLAILIGLATILVTVLVSQFALHRLWKPSAEWTKEFDGYDTESCIRLYDVDGDGRLDIIFSAGRLLNTSIADLFKDNASRQSFIDICKHRGETYPCLGELIALRGNDSAVLWSTRTHAWFFELNCGNIDVNLDGKPDCIGTGRFGAVVAFDPRNGSILWQASSEFLVPTWSSFNVAILPDYTEDGVPELLLPHSCDPRFPPELSITARQVHDRPAGRLIMLDGATGKSIGRYLVVPGGHETYTSPVVHKMPDGSAYILFGHGGETIPGSLLTISVPDFYRYVMQLDTKATVPHSLGRYNHWNSLPQTENPYVREIFRSGTAGVMVPPVCVDVNADGIHDILMLAFDGNLTMFDGRSVAVLWTVDFHGMQSYSTPAPGYFNDDDVLDFMLHLNHGTYPNYDYTTTVVVDGKTGKVLWSLNTTMFEMASDLVARTTESYHDVFIFRVKGRPLNQTRRVKRQDTFDSPPSRSRFRPALLQPRYNGRKTFAQTTSRPWQPSTGRRRGSLDDYIDPQQLPPRRYSDYDSAPAYDNPPPADYGGSPQYEFQDGGSRGGSGGQRQGEESMSPYGRDRDGVSGVDRRPRPPERPVDQPSTALSTTPTAATVTPQPAVRIVTSAVTNCGSAETAAAGLYAVDRSWFSTPLSLQQDPALPFTYNITGEDVKLPRRKRRHEEHGGASGGLPAGTTATGGVSGKEKCVLMTAEERTTGALGDVDGDGSLDAVSIVTMSAHVTDQYGRYVRSKKIARISKLNLELRLRYPGAVMNVPGRTGASSSLRLRPQSQQPWTSYLGSHGDSAYRST